MRHIKTAGYQQGFDYLMGAIFDKVKETFLGSAGQKPRVKLDVKDKLGRTALHYVL